jgi:hypothetical protein
MTVSFWESLGKSDEWWTPPQVFEALGCRFDTDVAAPWEWHRTFVPADKFISSASLAEPWHGFVWMNPPFGGRNGLAPWLDKFFRHGDGIALTPDRTSAPWFRDAWRHADAVLFTPKLRFIKPDGTEGKAPSNGTALWASGGRGAMALSRAAKKGLGILAMPLPVTDDVSAAVSAASNSAADASAWKDGGRDRDRTCDPYDVNVEPCPKNR